MNHLAHTLLAGDDELLQLGGLMGDFVHGQPDPDLPAGLVAGIRLHRAIDVYTDSHPEVAAARSLLPAPFRRYGGILLDMWFDHLLARQWSRFGEDDLDAFSDRVRDLLAINEDLVPERMRGFVGYLDANRLPAAYREVSVIGNALRGMSRRLKRANPLGDALPALVARHAPLQACFDAFFPALRNFAEVERIRLVESGR